MFLLESVKNGRVEGHMLISTRENTKITTSCWTNVDKRMLELNNNKRYLHPKTKKKLQWEGRKGAITIKSNPIHAGWATHKTDNNNAKRVFLLLWRFWDWMSGFPAWRTRKGTGSSQGIWLWRPTGFDYTTSTGLREIETPLLAQTKSCAHQDPRERSSDPTGDWTGPTS